MIMSSQPFEIIRWEAPREPDEEFLTYMLIRDGYEPERTELTPGTRSPEMKFDKTVIRVLISGKVQYSFPGYGSIDLAPGDILEISPATLHDIIVEEGQPGVILQAVKI